MNSTKEKASTAFKSASCSTPSLETHLTALFFDSIVRGSAVLTANETVFVDFREKSQDAIGFFEDSQKHLKKAKTPVSDKEVLEIFKKKEALFDDVAANPDDLLTAKDAFYLFKIWPIKKMQVLL